MQNRPLDEGMWEKEEGQEAQGNTGEKPEQELANANRRGHAH